MRLWKVENQLISQADKAPCDIGLMTSVIWQQCCPRHSWPCPICRTRRLLLTYVGVGREACERSGGTGSSSRSPSRVGWGGGCRGWGGRALNDPVEPGLDAGMALEQSGGESPRSLQRALIFWGRWRVCDWNNDEKHEVGMGQERERPLTRLQAWSTVLPHVTSGHLKDHLQKRA